MWVFFLLAIWGAVAPQAAPQPDAIGALLGRLEQAAAAGDRAGVLALGGEGSDRANLDVLASTLTEPRAARVVVRERDRTPRSAGTTRVLLEVLIERGSEASLGTWTVDIRVPADGSSPARIAGAERISNVSGLYRLALHPQKSFAVQDLVLRATDFSLEMASGSAFVAETAEGPTAVVLLGRGKMHFTPTDAAERTQVRIFAGSETLSSEFDAAFIRVRPSEFTTLFPRAALEPRPVDGQAFRRASGVFDEYVGRTLQIDLTDMSRDRWSLAPTGRDLIAEVRTRRHGSLTYTRSGNDAEDIALFDRRRRRNIAVYASTEKLASRGRFYSEDDLVEYDVLAYDIDVAITPDRLWIEGTSRLKVKIRARQTATLNLRLAESVTVRSVSSPQFGRLLHLRVVGQNSLLVNLPGSVVEGSEFWISVTYGGRVQPQSLDREALTVGQEPRETYIPIEPHYIYSNRSYWYPQSTVTDYATATVRISVPGGFEAVASGDPAGPPAPPPGVADASTRGRQVFLFHAAEPVRYISCIVSRFSLVEERKVAVDGSDIALVVHANPRLTGRARGNVADAAGILQYYSSLTGGAPYPSFLMTAVESDRPGGHSPPYFAIVNHVSASTEVVWRNDPVSFENYPLFFLAHEIAHQWWGHAVGWKNYHEQWISEGFAQYFAALYAEKQRGPTLFANLIRQMRHTAVAASPQGPIHLGYRLGHIRGDDRVYRAIIYNKGAMVLHMLRRLVGDEPFFRGVRAFYQEWKFRKAGSDDFRLAMEKATGRDLSRFFETWVYGAAIPELTFDSDVADGNATLTLEAREPVDAAITVTITYVSGRTEDVIVQMAGKSATMTVPLRERARSFAANADNAALVTVRK